MVRGPTRPRRRLWPHPSPGGCVEAMKLADIEAQRRPGEHLLLFCMTRDRDSEAPRHTSECCQDSAVPGQVDQALDGEADLKVDVEDGRFVFHGLAVEL